jgi:hypothetical protein
MTHPEQPTSATSADRRNNTRLRELVDEMMASIRAAANVELWSPEERARYEADLARIMDNVRQQAMARGGAPRSHLS